MMSANITAASTSWRRTGCRVTSAQSSGCSQTSKSVCRLRISRYSGSERPAWRMNQTGVRSICSRRAARTRSGAAHAPTLVPPWSESASIPSPPALSPSAGAAYRVPPIRAGEPAVARVLLENAGSAPWRSRGREGVQLGSHWLDPLGNPIVWDGAADGVRGPGPPGEVVELKLRLAARGRPARTGSRST